MKRRTMLLTHLFLLFLAAAEPFCKCGSKDKKRNEVTTMMAKSQPQNFQSNEVLLVLRMRLAKHRYGEDKI